MSNLNIQNLNKLIDHLRTLAPERFNMKEYFSSVEAKWKYRDPDEAFLIDCDTAACIAGWCNLIRQASWEGSGVEAAYLGLTNEQARQLFYPAHVFNIEREHAKRRPLARAIDVLCHLRDTSEVRWDLFPPESYPVNFLPVPPTIEPTRPTLPEEITRYLDQLVPACPVS